MIKQLEAHALANYEAGGHWVYETYDDVDYEAIVAEAEGNLERAKELLQEAWEFLVEREQECSFGDGEF